jgi:hypothetical protein
MKEISEEHPNCYNGLYQREHPTPRGTPSEGNTPPIAMGTPLQEGNRKIEK